MVRRRSRKSSRGSAKIPSRKENRSNSGNVEFYDYFLGKENEFVPVRKGGRRRRNSVKRLRSRRTSSRRMGNTQGSLGELDPEEQERVLDFDCSAKHIIEKLKEGEYKNVVVMAGAGISVSCGIPDFRTPGSGLYDNLKRYNLPSPESVFELDYFKETKGHAFYKLAKEMWPDNFHPSPTHLFIRMLNDKGYLSRCFTQNIDTLERAAGVSNEKLVEAHGSFATASCIKCKQAYDQDECKKNILKGQVPIRCCKAGCGGLVKPDIVFFGEGLPGKFEICSKTDLPKADLLIIMGTSLTVHPFASLVEMVSPECPRLLLNMKPVNVRSPSDGIMGLRLRQAENYRDVMIEGTCDDAVRAICDGLEWRDELEKLVEEYQSKVGVEKEPIDVAKSFPNMAPGGLAYNWRIGKENAPPLPSLTPPTFVPESFETDQLEGAAEASEANMAVFAIEEYTKLTKGGALTAMLCLIDDAHTAWDLSHSVALVNMTDSFIDFETIQNCVELTEPMTQQNGRQKCSYHQLVFNIPYEQHNEYQLWYVDTSSGKVTMRWGPFVTSEASGDEEQKVQGIGSLEADIDDIVQSMADLPAHLQSPSEE
uniref:Deacetylase sirtuin-type domain-containing protein n=1 Tax=Mucochytrium quahogii TaxID=96639 RepID=A0A7S2WA06_9STRA|mmetsp:Transcript_72/g.165  ORF Transcript_72/g.165 Transcript_72/m.165 type:complete len:594 (-) Transcript_72:98-1879(-)|eukprot:CAMPEP_0203760904 /NCGR_PEP_ID=MMETSP0098-20131031/14093_1 /ASSEMBLY_ACC=CAM_ASM_000208 /TAXON_ID=96639 /ORGANISM=" , Strain NY0313808BC1" /LENGTH=593 /DNA_ID=CAMNT_0050654657 /DNA_START=350 /DNA_END=2131 /DNA_ORIENTATION=+